LPRVQEFGRPSLRNSSCRYCCHSLSSERTPTACFEYRLHLVWHLRNASNISFVIDMVGIASEEASHNPHPGPAMQFHSRSGHSQTLGIPTPLDPLVPANSIIRMVRAGRLEHPAPCFVVQLGLANSVILRHGWQRTRHFRHARDTQVVPKWHSFSDSLRS
jgi:hypothetical protein